MVKFVSLVCLLILRGDQNIIIFLEQWRFVGSLNNHTDELISLDSSKKCPHISKSTFPFHLDQCVGPLLWVSAKLWCSKISGCVRITQRWLDWRSKCSKHSRCSKWSEWNEHSECSDCNKTQRMVVEQSHYCWNAKRSPSSKYESLPMMSIYC